MVLLRKGIEDMSKGGTSTSSSIDPRVFDLLKTNYQHAQGIADQPYQPYSGALVAAPSGATASGENALLSGAMNAGSDALSKGVNATDALTSFQPLILSAPATSASALTPSYAAPASIGAPSFSTAASASPAAVSRASIASVTPQSGLGQIGNYLNPYVQNVVNATMADLDRQRRMALNQNAAGATLSNAFGGDRQAVENALTNEGFARQMANTDAALRSQGFDTAAGLLQNDQSRALQAGLANQGVDASVAGQNAGYAQQAALANQATQNQAGLYNAGAANDIARQNAELLQQAGLFNASQGQGAAQYNAGAQNQIALANQDAALRALLANQQAGLSGAQLGLSAAGQLGNLAGQQQQNYLTGANAMLGVGAQRDAYQQALLDSAYQQFLRQQGFPVDMQQVLNSALGMFGSSGTQQVYQRPDTLTPALGTAGSLAMSAIAVF
jgi:hypothetical protein